MQKYDIDDIPVLAENNIIAFVFGSFKVSSPLHIDYFDEVEEQGDNQAPTSAEAVETSSIETVVFTKIAQKKG